MIGYLDFRCTSGDCSSCIVPDIMLGPLPYTPPCITPGYDIGGIIWPYGIIGIIGIIGRIGIIGIMGRIGRAGGFGLLLRYLKVVITNGL